MTQTSITPTHLPDQSQATLRELYIRHDFDARLQECERTGGRNDFVPYGRRKPEDTYHTGVTEFEQGAKFRENGQTIAVIFWYWDISGEKSEVIRSLRVGDTVYDALVRS